MSSGISGKSDLSRYDAACGLAILARELCETCEVWTFDHGTTSIPARRGFALRDALGRPAGGTNLGAAVLAMNSRSHDRLIVLTDEQSADVVGPPRAKGYIINVAAYQNGVGFGPWVKVSGFSEQVMAWIQQNESY